MASAIDPTKPEDGVPARKGDLRSNLQAAKTEIEHGGFADGLDPDNYGPPATSRVRDHLSAIDAALGQFGPANSFIGLSDTPASYAGQATRFVKVRPDETGLEFAPAPGGSGGLTGWVDVKADFGASGNGSTNDTQAIQSALSSGAAVVYFPPGTYRVTSQLTVTPGTVLIGNHRSNTIIHALEAAVGSNQGLLFCAGTRTALPSINQTINEHAASISFSSSVSATLSHGDWFYVYDDTDSSFNGDKATNKDGFFAKVHTAEGSTVYTSHPLLRTLPAPRTGGPLSNLKAYRMDQRGLVMNGLTVRGPGYDDISGDPGSDTNILACQYLARVHIDNCEIIGAGKNALHFEHCADVHLNNSTFSNLATDWNNFGAYGVLVRGGAYIYATNCIAISSRHAWNIDGWFIPCHDVYISGGVVMAPGTALFQQPGSSLVTAFNTHSACRHVIIQGARIYGGIDLRGSGHVIKDCLISSGASNNGAVFFAGAGPHLEAEIVGNTFHVFNPHFEGGTLLQGTNSDFDIDANSVPCHLKFNDNVCYIRSPSAGAGPLITLQDTSAKNSGVGIFEICRNQFICTVSPSSPPAWFNINFNGHFIRVQDNFATHGTLGTWNTGFTHSIKSGNFVNGSQI